jgi:hypothetical protein
MAVETELEMVQRHIRKAAGLIERQREIVGLTNDARLLARARELLSQLEKALDLHEQHLARLLHSSETPAPPSPARTPPGANRPDRD